LKEGRKGYKIGNAKDRIGIEMNQISADEICKQIDGNDEVNFHIGGHHSKEMKKFEKINDSMRQRTKWRVK
jgi:hypothetical protein